MKKKFLCILLCLFLLTPTVFAQDVTDNIPKAWNEVIEKSPVSVDEFKAMTLNDYVQKALDLLKANLLSPLKLLAQLCGLLILTAAAKSLTDEPPPGAIAALTDTVVTLAAFSLCCAPVLQLMSVMQAALESSRVYIGSFVPVFSAVMISCGQAGSATVYSSLFFGASMLISDIIVRFGLPLTRVFIALHAASAVGSTFDTESLAETLERWLKWILTLCATVFATLIGLQSMLAQSADSFALKTGKFLVGSGVPVVGRAVSDALGSVLAGMKMLKGTIGFSAIVVIIAIFLPIILQCTAYHIVFTLSSIIASSTGNIQTKKLLSGFAQCVSIYISMIFFFCIMVIATTMIMILIGTGSG